MLQVSKIGSGESIMFLDTFSFIRFVVVVAGLNQWLYIVQCLQRVMTGQYDKVTDRNPSKFIVTVRSDKNRFELSRMTQIWSIMALSFVF